MIRKKSKLETVMDKLHYPSAILIAGYVIRSTYDQSIFEGSLNKNALITLGLITIGTSISKIYQDYKN